VEINGDVKRDQVGKLVRELMEGERGNEMKKKAMEWKTKAYEAASPSGSSCRNFENLLASRHSLGAKNRNTFEKGKLEVSPLHLYQPKK
jgi:hypothetical protein